MPYLTDDLPVSNRVLSPYTDALFFSRRLHILPYFHRVRYFWNRFSRTLMVVITTPITMMPARMRV